MRKCLEPNAVLDDENISFETKRFLRRVHRYCHDRSLFKTREGYVGLGPAAAAAGDLVAILLDCASPLVLRPKPEKQFLVVGEAYCDGFMDCEAFLGPIPHSLKPVTRYDEASAVWRWAHVDHTSGHIYPEDPRLGPLPNNWTRTSHARESFWTWFVNKVTGEELKYDHDPRITIEAFKTRGVELQTFNLT